MLSICIPTYEQKGVGPYMVTQLLRSIQKQTLKTNYEIIIADNSTDTLIFRTTKNFPDLPITYYQNPVRGASENINFALDRATGDKVKLMMQDDLLALPNALELFINALDGPRWAFSNSIQINSNGIRTGRARAKYIHGNFDKNTVGMPSVIAFHKNHLRFDTRLKTFCDVYFYYQLYEFYGPPAVIPDFAVAQRYHNASLSRNQPPSHKADKDFLISQGLIKAANV